MTDSDLMPDDCEHHNYFNFQRDDTHNSSKFDESMEDSRVGKKGIRPIKLNYVLAIKRSLVQGMPFNK